MSIETRLIWHRIKDVQPEINRNIIYVCDTHVHFGTVIAYDVLSNEDGCCSIDDNGEWAYFNIPKTKEFHVWLDTLNFPTFVPLQTVYDTTKAKLNCKEAIIHTTQTAFLKTSILEDYKLFVHRYGQQIEITLGSCQGTDRDIKAGDNLEKLVLAGEFDFHK